MSRPEAIRVDAQAGRIAWDEAGAARRATIEGAVDARYDSENHRLIVLVRTPEREEVAIVSMSGETLAFIPAPHGYSLSHFADAEEPVLTGQGEEPVDGWHDWHFRVDEDGRTLRRLGPAY